MSSTSVMLSLSKHVRFVIFIAALVAAMSFNVVWHFNGKAKLVIRFENYVGDELLQLDSINYKNELNQSHTISKFKYYISNIRLKNISGKEFVSKEYFLVNEEEENSKQIELNDLNEGEYDSISFTVGVDSIHNCSRVQSGALDPMNAMFWAWNTGYIFMKIEGHTPVSKSPGNIFEFHIGGFKQPNNCIRTVTLNLKDLKMKDGKNSTLRIKTDASEIFKSPTSIDFSKISSVTDTHNATMIADNYKDMFTTISNR